MNVTNGRRNALLTYSAAPAGLRVLRHELGVGEGGEQRERQRDRERRPDRAADPAADLADERVDARAEHVADDEQQQHVARDRALEGRVVAAGSVDRGRHEIRPTPSARGAAPARRKSLHSGRAAGERAPPPVPCTLMTRKSITTTRAAVACDVCGRTLLRGEHADPFIAGGARRMVCELCTARAANEGWIREGADNTLGVRRNGPRGGRSLLGRLRPSRPAGRRAPADEAAVPVSRRGYSNVDRIEKAERVADAAEADERRASPPSRTPTRPRPRRSPRRRPPRASRATCAPCRPTPTSRWRARSTSSTPRPTRGGSPASRARSASRPSPCCRRRPRARSSRSSSVGSCAGIATRSTSPTRPPGVRVTGQGAELSELSAAEHRANAAADERGLLVLAG